MNDTTVPDPAAPGDSVAPPAWLKPSFRLSLLRSAMHALGRLSPGAAAGMMTRLWFSPPRPRSRTVHKDLLGQANRRSFEVHGRHVAGWQWGSDGPTVLLMHGWGGTVGDMCSFVAPLRALGFTVLAIDAPGHGESAESRRGGRKVTFFEFADALRVVARTVDRLSALIAHSGGCTAVSLAIREGWQAPERMVFVSPFAVPSAAIDGFAGAIGANEAVVSTFRQRVETWLGRPWSYLNIAGSPDRRDPQPLLIVHDSNDREVPLLHAVAVVETWPGAELHITQGLGHRRILGDAKVVQRAISFVTQEPSGNRRGREDYTPGDSREELDSAYEGSGLIWSRQSGKPCFGRYRGPM